MKRGSKGPQRQFAVGVTSLVTSDLGEIPVDASGMWQQGRCLLAGKSHIRGSVSPSTTLLYGNDMCLLFLSEPTSLVVNNSYVFAIVVI